MKYRIYSISLLTGLLLGCANAEVSLQAEKNVAEYKQLSPTRYQVYCPTGICRFQVSASQKTAVTIEMFYDKNKPFKKIEGLTYDNQNQYPTSNAFTLPVESGNERISVQVIDYYR
ncbi:spore gernimation protein [Vibrio campbellii]|uniref:spore gernimation protein n=1 Tax=Vibrio campbellii TaxID=680 RepID=UPI0009A4EE61|nr:spore gernimation protein [Vibrio campbellii]OPH51014.1 spore gernimation protein [Vibrio campbellii]